MSVECTYCGKYIAGNVSDPINHVSAGRFHTACMREHASAAPVEPKSDGRGEAARKRWEAMTPEQKAERVKKLQAGRRRQ